MGDIFIERYGKYFFIKKEGYHHVKDLFREDANFYTFFGRLLPVVRQLISIPAGMAHMPYGRFITLSLTGSALWLIVLIALGYVIGDNQELIKSYIGQISAVIVICVALLWIVRHYRKKYATKKH